MFLFNFGGVFLIGKPKLFTENQEKFILDNYKELSNIELSTILNCKPTQVKSWLLHRGIKRGKYNKYYNQIFSEDDVKFIKENYLNMSYKEIGDILGFAEHQIQGKICKLKLPKKNRVINDDYFNQIDTPLKAYFLGYIYADGWICKEEKYSTYEFAMELSEIDRYILDMLNDELGGNNLISHKCYREIKYNGKIIHSNPTYTLRVFSKNVVYSLINHGIETNKTLKEIFPIVDNNLFFDFLRGYIDGDGCYYNDNGQTYMHITSATEPVLIYLKDQLEKYDIKTKVYKENDRKYRLMCTNKLNMTKLVSRLYYEDGLFCLTRKYERVKHLLSFAA